MAFFGQQQSRIPDGQFTSTIYGYIKDQKYDEAITILQQELQASRMPAR